MLQSSLSDTDMIVKVYLLLLQQAWITSAQKVIGNGLGFSVLGAEELIVDYAELAADKEANLPSQVCLTLGLLAFTCISSSLYARLLLWMLLQMQFASSNFSVSLELHGLIFAWMLTANPRYLRYR